MRDITEAERERMRLDPRWARVQTLRHKRSLSDSEWEEVVKLETELSRELFGKKG